MGEKKRGSCRGERVGRLWCFFQFAFKQNKGNHANKVVDTKGSLYYRLCFEYFPQFKIDSETYTYLAAVLKDGDVSKQVKLPIWKLFWSK